jgi:hypothetical protein
LRPTRPMIHPITGSTMMVNRVSCKMQLTLVIMEPYGVFGVKKGRIRALSHIMTLSQRSTTTHLHRLRSL